MRFFKKPIFVFISPNAQIDDVWLAFKLLLQPWKWIDGNASAKLITELKKYLGVKHAFVFSSGRASLYGVLKALDVKENDEVLVQAFTCTAVINPILWLGAKPIYVDIDKNGYNMSPEDLLRKINPGKSKVIIIQHTFGLAANLDEILEIAKNNDLLTIEDATHALGAEYKNKKIGTFGDAAIFSFGRFKIISAVFGGAVTTDNSEMADKLEEFNEKLNYPPRFWIFQQIFHPILLAFAKPFYNIFSLGKLKVIIAKKLNLLSPVIYQEEKLGHQPPFLISRLPNVLALLGLNQFKKLDVFNNHRIGLADIYKKEFNNFAEVKLPVSLPKTKDVYLNFPIQLEYGKSILELIVSGGKKQGIYLENWPARESIIGPDGVDLEKMRYQKGSCPNAENIVLRSVILPTSPNTREKDVLRVCNFIKKFLKDGDN